MQAGTFRQPPTPRAQPSSRRAVDRPAARPRWQMLPRCPPWRAHEGDGRSARHRIARRAPGTLSCVLVSPNPAARIRSILRWQRGALVYLHLFAELKRRRVFRALVGYGIAAFAILQIVEPVMHGLRWPEVTLSYVVVALAIGFPIVVTLAWIFDVNAGRLERTPASGRERAPRGQPAPRRRTADRSGGRLPSLVEDLRPRAEGRLLARGRAGPRHRAGAQAQARAGCGPGAADHLEHRGARPLLEGSLFLESALPGRLRESEGVVREGDRARSDLSAAPLRPAGLLQPFRRLCTGAYCGSPAQGKGARAQGRGAGRFTRGGPHLARNGERARLRLERGRA